MTEAPKRIWAESMMERWNSGTWARRSCRSVFPEERAYVPAELYDEAIDALKLVDESDGQTLYLVRAVIAKAGGKK